MAVAAALEAAATQYGVGSAATEIPEHLKPFVITRPRDADFLTPDWKEYLCSFQPGDRQAQCVAKLNVAIPAA